MRPIRRTRPRTRRAAGPRALRVLGVAAVVLSLTLLIVLGIGGVMVMSARASLPDISEIYSPPTEATRLYDVNGELIASLYRENRAAIPLSQIPSRLREAVLAVEDRRFYHHHGFDPIGIARAVVANVLRLELEQGASTITQQLARTLFLTPERTARRKIAEVLLAIEIERRLTKDEILERYLNEVYFGQGAYGIEMASRVYFGKATRDLTLAEAAMLAGLIQAPSAYSPYEHFAAAKARQRVVLAQMARAGYLREAQAEAAAASPVILSQRRNAGLLGIRAPYFVSYVLPYLLERYGEDAVYKSGLRVYTTLDVAMQAAAERAVRAGVAAGLEAGLRTSQGALVAVDPRTGSIRAMIGGVDFQQSQFNRAWQARRQPGSAFKPFIYVTAIQSGATPTRMIDDAPITYTIPGSGTWSPKNYDGKFRGPVALRYAVEHSINVPAVKTLEELTPPRVIETARRMGIASPLRPNLSLALGTSEVTPLEMASAFGVLAAGGVRAAPTAIVRVTDRVGRVLEETMPQRTPVVGQDVAYVMTDILRGVIARGTGRAADIGRPAAGKTGTTDDYRNAWFIGYTPVLSAAAWVGNDDNTPMNHVAGGSVPARIWAAFMRAALADQPKTDWSVPPGVVVTTVCGDTGRLATASCPTPRREVFIRGTEPTEYETAPTPSRAGLSLGISAPANGAAVHSPFAIVGATEPGATVLLQVFAEGSLFSIKAQERRLPVDDQGEFSFVYTPSLRIPGIHYLITVTARASDGRTASVSIRVTEE